MASGTRRTAIHRVLAILLIVLLAGALVTSAQEGQGEQKAASGAIISGGSTYVDWVAASTYYPSEEHGGLDNVPAITGVVFNPANGHSYELVEVHVAGVDWSEARDAAAAMLYKGVPGHLATATSAQEEDFLVSSFPEIYPEYVWLGASDEATEGDWQWITGEAWSYTDWADGEPNGGTYENCLQFGDFVAQWNDSSCDRSFYFYMVEYSDIPIEGLDASNDSPTLLGSATTLTATVTAGSDVTYTWAFGDGNFGSGPEVSHIYPDVGFYTAVVTASNSIGELTATTTVTITDAPIGGLVATNDSPTPLGEATTLTATVTAGSNVTFTWAFDDGQFGSGAVVSHTYPAVDIYTALVTASNSISELTATTTVTITQVSFDCYLPLVFRSH